MSLLDGYEGVIFDLDGTLVDSMPAWEGLCRAWAETRGLTLPEGLEADIACMTTAQSAEHVIRILGLEQTTEEIQAEWSDLLTGRYRALALPKEGADALLRRLASAGIPLGLATSSLPCACREFLEAHGWDSLFRAVVYTQDTGRDKRAPDVWLACAEGMGVSPRHCVVLEDLSAAMEGTAAAGMDFIAVHDAGTSGKEWDYMCKYARNYLYSLKELL